MATIIERIRNIFTGYEKRALGVPTGLRDSALFDIFGAQANSSAGIAITETTALQCSAVYAAVRVISESAASLPLCTYRVGLDGSRKLDKNNPLYYLLEEEPSPGISSMVWRESFLSTALRYGNAYAEIERDYAGRVVSLWQIAPERVTPERDTLGAIRYQIRNTSSGDVGYLDSDDMLHLRGPSRDGLIGWSVIRQARESIGLTMAAERFGAKLFGSGAKPSGVLEHPGRLSDDARVRLRSDFERMQSGIENAHKIAVLEEGMKWTPSSIPPDDAQFLQTREFQISEVARWFNVPTSKLRDSAGKSFSSLESDNQAFLTETLRPWLIRLEQEMQIKLLTQADRGTLYFAHDVDSLLRADIKTRFEVYAQGRNWGIYSVNEIRHKENLPPIEGGDTYLQPLNMQGLNMPAGPSALSATPALTEAPVDAPTATATPPVGAGVNQYSRSLRAKYDGIDFTPPAGVRDEAQQGLDWREEYNRGGTMVGVARARDLSNGVSVSPDTIGRMVSYFARHEVDKQGQGYQPGEDGYPSAGRIAWALWGGDPGQTWSQKVSDQMDAAEA